MECSSRRTPFSFLRGTAHWSGGSAFSGSALPNSLCSEKSIPPWANPTCLSFLFTCPQSPWAFRDMSFPTFPSAAFSDLSQGTVIHGLGDHSPHVHLNLPICELLPPPLWTGPAAPSSRSAPSCLESPKPHLHPPNGHCRSVRAAGTKDHTPGGSKAQGFILSALEAVLPKPGVSRTHSLHRPCWSVPASSAAGVPGPPWLVAL